MIARLGLAGLLFLSLVVTATAEDFFKPLQGTVSWVYDGDTLEIPPYGPVRLIGIDAPEREASGRDQYLEKQGVDPARIRHISAAAKNFNMRHVKGKPVRLTFDRQGRDRHGRLLAYVYLPDGRLLNRVLLRQGLAVVYRRFSFQLKKDFIATEELARQARIGIWATDPHRTTHP